MTDIRQAVCEALRRAIYVNIMNTTFISKERKVTRELYDKFGKFVLTDMFVEIKHIFNFFVIRSNDDFVNKWNAYIIFKKYVTGVMINKCVGLYEKNYEKQTKS